MASGNGAYVRPAHWHWQLKNVLLNSRFFCGLAWSAGWRAFFIVLLTPFCNSGSTELVPDKQFK